MNWPNSSNRINPKRRRGRQEEGRVRPDRDREPQSRPAQDQEGLPADARVLQASVVEAREGGAGEAAGEGALPEAARAGQDGGREGRFGEVGHHQETEGGGRGKEGGGEER